MSVVRGWGAASLLILFTASTANAQLFDHTSYFLLPAGNIGIDKTDTATVLLRVRLETDDPSPIRQAMAASLRVPVESIVVTRVPLGWIFLARVEGVVSHRGLTKAVEFDLDQLTHELGRTSSRRLTLSVNHPTYPFSESPGADDRTVLFFATSYTYSLPTQDPAPRISISFGYRMRDVWMQALLIPAWLLPLGLILWQRQRVSQCWNTADPAESWLKFWRWQRLFQVCPWLLWLSAVAVLDTDRLLRFTLGPVGVTPFQIEAMLLAVPALGAFCWEILAAPVLARLPGAWSREEIIRCSFWRHLALLVLIVTLAQGIDAVLARDTFTASLWSMGGTLLFLYLLIPAMLPLSLVPLPPGELRDRILEMAEDANVTIKHCWLVPPIRWRLLAVFGHWRSSVHLTPMVLSLLTRREVDALLTHELLYATHRGYAPRSGAWLNTGMIILGFLILFSVPRVFELDRNILTAPLLVIGVWVVLQNRANHFARAFDKEVVRMTGDPEALITALAKLEKHGLLPVPSSSDRIEKIAHRHFIPPERLQEIVAGPGSGEGHYELPPGSVESKADTLETAAYLRTGATLVTCGAILMSAIVPVLAFWIARSCGVEGVWQLLTAAGVVVAVLLIHEEFGEAGFAWFDRQVQRRLRERLAREEQSLESSPGIYVGISGGPHARVHEALYDWDRGLLLVEQHRVVYLGDRSRFALRPGMITRVELGAAPPGWWPVPRVVIHWHDTERGASGVFSLAVRGIWPSRERSANRDLYRRLQEWYAGAVHRPDEKLDTTLPSPELPVTGQSPRTLGTFTVMLWNIFVVVVLTVFSALLVGLPFSHMTAEGTLAIVSAVLITSVEGLPFWFYREAQPRTAGER